MKLIYATDLDRTLIFSKRFISENKSNTDKTVVERRENGDVISYMSNDVMVQLKEIDNNDSLTIVPVTTRSIKEYNRIELPIVPKYAILDTGGTILENGEPIKEYEEYIQKNTDMMEMLQCALDINEMNSINRDCKLIDNKYIFNKTMNPELFDKEAELIAHEYSSLEFTRHGNKVYVIPKCFNKAIALRWLYHYIKADVIVASGDSELDLPMLAIANYATIPNHGVLIKEGYVTHGRIIEGGIDSPLETIKLIKDLVSKK